MIMQKILRFLFIVLTISSLGISCNPLLAKKRTILTLQVNVDNTSYCIGEKIIVTALLENTGDLSVLVDSHWTLMPVLLPPEMSSGALFLLDSSNKLVSSGVRIEVPPVNKENFVILRPGEHVEKIIALHDFSYGGTYSYPFQESERYTVVAIYQNVLEFSKMYENERIKSWTGKLSSSDAFIVEAGNCHSE